MCYSGKANTHTHGHVDGDYDNVRFQTYTETHFEFHHGDYPKFRGVTPNNYY
jgi:hypothetical protein